MNGMVTLRPGGFYRSKSGDVWCCYRIDDSGPVQAQARCVMVSSGRLEYFFKDGRYDSAGKREHCLIVECSP